MIARMEVLANELSKLLDEIREEGFKVIGIDASDYAYIDLSDGEHRTPVDAVPMVSHTEAPPYSRISL